MKLAPIAIGLLATGSLALPAFARGGLHLLDNRRAAVIGWCAVIMLRRATNVVPRRTAAARESAWVLGDRSNLGIGKPWIASARRDDTRPCSDLCCDRAQLQHLGGNCRRRIWRDHRR